MTTTNSAIMTAIHSAMDSIYLQLGMPITTLIIAGNEPSKSVIANEYKKSCKKAIAASGHKSINCGDEYAIAFEGMKLQDIADLSADILTALGKPITSAELMAKYAHLNPGMQRMNIVNRVRNASNAAKAAAQKSRDDVYAECLAAAE